MVQRGHGEYVVVSKYATRTYPTHSHASTPFIPYSFHPLLPSTLSPSLTAASYVVWLVWTSKQVNLGVCSSIVSNK